MALNAWKDQYRSENIQICESMNEDRPSIFLPDEKQPKIRPPEGFLSQFL